MGLVNLRGGRLPARGYMAHLGFCRMPRRARSPIADATAAAASRTGEPGRSSHRPRFRGRAVEWIGTCDTGYERCREERPGPLMDRLAARPAAPASIRLSTPIVAAENPHSTPHRVRVAPRGIAHGVAGGDARTSRLFRREPPGSARS